MVDWEHVKQRHVTLSTRKSEEHVSATCRSLFVRSVDQRRIFWLFMFEPNQHLDARLHECFFPRDCVFCTWFWWVHSVGIFVGISPSESWHGIDRDWWRTPCRRIVSINYALAFSCCSAFCDKFCKTVRHLVIFLCRWKHQRTAVKVHMWSHESEQLC